MSEIAENFKLLHEKQKEARWHRSRMNLAALDQAGIKYIYQADSGTVIIGKYQFWTTTGKWMKHGTRIRGIDADTFIRAIRNEEAVGE